VASLVQKAAEDLTIIPANLAIPTFPNNEWPSQGAATLIQKSESLQHHLMDKAMRETRSPTYLNSSDPHLFPSIG